MNASELVSTLIEIIRRHGDLPVKLQDQPIIEAKYVCREGVTVIDLTPEIPFTTPHK